jgi:hypothetical protein
VSWRTGTNFSAVASAVQPDLGVIEQRRREPPTYGRSALMVMAAIVMFLGLVLLLYAAAIHANPGDSDGASIVLEAHAMGHGHLLLDGWELSLDSFWTIDALFYMVAVFLDGIRPSLMYAIPALLAALVIAGGVVMAREGRRGATAIAGGATVVALLAFPTHAMALFFLRGPLHIGTTLWALIAFWCLRKRRFGWEWVVAVVVLAAGALGDLQILLYGIAPAVIAGIVAMLRTRSWRGGITQITAGIAGLALAGLVRTIANIFGTYSVSTVQPIELHLLLSNIKRAASPVAELIGVQHKEFTTAGVPSAIQDVHFIGALVITVSFFCALFILSRDALLGRQRSIPIRPGMDAQVGNIADTLTERSQWPLDDMLLLAIFGPLLAYGTLTVNPKDPEYARYLTAAVIFSAILAGRMVARFAVALMPRSNTHRRASAAPRPSGINRSFVAAGLIVVLSFGAGVGYNLAQPDPGQPAAQLASFLALRHLTNGVGSYWSASIVTVESGGKVAVRPVFVDGRNGVVRYPRESPTTGIRADAFSSSCSTWQVHGDRTTPTQPSLPGGDRHASMPSVASASLSGRLYST